MARVTARRATATATLATALVLLLTACIPLPFTGESSDGMTNSIDTAAIAAAVTATSDSIETTVVETNLSGVNTHLWVAPQITTAGFTAAELDAVLRIAYEQSRGEVTAIEIATLDANEKTIDLTPAASELGIKHMANIDTVTYSTVYLDEAYGK